ncbi:unnamed protein product [Ixodes pacificus]
MPSGCYYGSYCCVAWCKNNGKTHKKPGTKFFRIPRDARFHSGNQLVWPFTPVQLRRSEPYCA